MMNRILLVRVPGDRSGDLALWVCVGLYGLALLYALVQLTRHVAAASRQRKRQRQKHARGAFVAGGQGECDDDSMNDDEDVEPVVMSMTKPFAQMSAAFVLRIFWLVATVLDVFPKPLASEQTCYNSHIVVSASNRVAQLLLYSSYSAVVSFWATVYERYQWHQLAQRSLEQINKPDQVSLAMARSTVYQALHSNRNSRNNTNSIMTTSNDLHDDDTRDGRDDMNEQQHDESRHGVEHGMAGDWAKARPGVVRRNITSSMLTGSSLTASGLGSLWALLWRPGTLLVLVHFWLYLGVLVLLFVQLVDCDSRQVYDTIYDAETIVIALFYAMLSALFFVHGLRLWRTLSHPEFASYFAKNNLGAVRGATEDTTVAKQNARWVVRRNTALIAVVCVLAFTGRGVLFLLRPLFGVKLTGQAQQILYPWAFYTIPELVPSLLMMFMLPPQVSHPNKKKARQLQVDIDTRTSNIRANISSTDAPALQVHDQRTPLLGPRNSRQQQQLQEQHIYGHSRSNDSASINGSRSSGGLI